jgi:hypothetical protein
MDIQVRDLQETDLRYGSPEGGLILGPRPQIIKVNLVVVLPLTEDVFWVFISELNIELSSVFIGPFVT